MVAGKGRSHSKWINTSGEHEGERSRPCPGGARTRNPRDANFEPTKNTRAPGATAIQRPEAALADVRPRNSKIVIGARMPAGPIHDISLTGRPVAFGVGSKAEGSRCACATPLSV